MSFKFTVLASGSLGNASLVEVDGFGVLIDLGLGPRQLAGRLEAAGGSWRRVNAVVLSHLHCDHWKEPTIKHLARLQIPLYCHEEHAHALAAQSPGFGLLQAAGLARTYVPGADLHLAAGLRCRAFGLSHDGGATCGFRLEGARDVFGRSYAVGYAADLGTWGPEHVAALRDVDLLALEFNHDVALEKSSGRSPRLIARVLGDDGHLSNVQAAALLRRVLEESEPGRPSHLIQLHLSRDCNHPTLAMAEAKKVARAMSVILKIHAAGQDDPSPTMHLGEMGSGAGRGLPRKREKKLARSKVTFQPMLPGMEVDELVP